jgi:hypothetical protein
MYPDRELIFANTLNEMDAVFVLNGTEEKAQLTRILSLNSGPRFVRYEPIDYQDCIVVVWGFDG